VSREQGGLESERGGTTRERCEAAPTMVETKIWLNETGMLNTTTAAPG